MIVALAACCRPEKFSFAVSKHRMGSESPGDDAGVPPLVVYCSNEEDDGGVDVLHTMNHRSIEEEDAPSDGFSEWWPDIGRALIESLYHTDNNVRRNAIQLMMPITERFPRTDVMHMTVTTPEIKRLHDLYARKLVIEQKRLDTIASEWIERIDRLCRACRQEEERARITKQRLLKKAEEIVAAHGAGVGGIVTEQLARVVQHIEVEQDLRVQIARLQAHVQRDAGTHLDRTHLDMEIRKTEHELSARFPPETLDSTRQTYMAHIRNIEHQVSNRVQERCQCDWVGGLA